MNPVDQRVLNYSAGPSQMPLSVLEKAREELLCYPGAGCSVMEMSHRTPAFEAILQHAKEQLRYLMAIPDNYEILFMQGGATTQFSAVAMNLASQGDTMAYVQTGVFATKAYDEGARFGHAVFAASSKDDGYHHLPLVTELPEDAAFLHITGNNTIFGSSYNDLDRLLPALKDPRYASVPLVADWSSAILGRGIDVSQYGLIYAGAQKNMGPAGLAVVIIRRDLLEREVDPIVPIMLRYKVAAEHDSMYNTPPTFSIYMAGLMFDWVREQGGVEAMEVRNRARAQQLYDYLDASPLYQNHIHPLDRSIMNVTFTLPTEELTKSFLAMAARDGLINLKGHRLSGGVRASLYNGMPDEGVTRLLEELEAFRRSL